MSIALGTGTPSSDDPPACAEDVSLLKKVR